MFFSFIACPICHARTSLTAMASNSSRLPSSPRKSSSVVSLAVERITFFFLAILISSFFKFTAPAARKDHVVRRGLLGLLDEPLKDTNAPLLPTQPHPTNPFPPHHPPPPPQT